MSDRSLGKRVGKAATVAAVAATVAVAALLALPKGGAVGPAGFGLLAIASGSMEPALPAGALALVVAQETYGVGEVVTYRSAQGALVTHRIVAMEDKDVVAQGDANNVADAPVPLGAVEGKVVAFVPGVGSVALWAKRPYAVLVLVAAAAAFLAFPVLRRKEKAGR